MSYRADAEFKVTELEAELRTIAKWFNKTHGGPEIGENDLAEMGIELRTLTVAMLDRRSAVGKKLREYERTLEVA